MHKNIPQNLLLLSLLFCLQTEIINAQNADSLEILVNPEIMPMFPGCEEIGTTYSEKKTCADKKLLDFIYANLEYPKGGACIEGIAVISFIVTEDGSIKDIKILRDPGAGAGEEARKVVIKMAEMKEKWTPGKLLGKPVSMRYNLPIRFRL